MYVCFLPPRCHNLTWPNNTVDAAASAACLISQGSLLVSLFNSISTFCDPQFYALCYAPLRGGGLGHERLTSTSSAQSAAALSRFAVGLCKSSEAASSAKPRFSVASAAAAVLLCDLEYSIGVFTQELALLKLHPLMLWFLSLSLSLCRPFADCF